MASEFATDRAPFLFRRGTRPLLVSIPHCGTYVPACVSSRFTEEARLLADTDWHLERLYAFAEELGASVLVATHSRYVIDLNRPPDNASLYPGKSVTSLCPVDTFEMAPIYRLGLEPDDAEVASRLTAIWEPYHFQLEAELERMRCEFGAAALWDAHSIKSAVPRFFDGRLSELNLGTAKGQSCSPVLAQSLMAIASRNPRHSATLDGRFTGGFITRHYGRPQHRTHAVQLEMTHSCYMNESPPFSYLPEVAAQVQPQLRDMLQAVLAFVEGQAA